MVPHEDVDVEKKEEEVEPCKPAMPEFPEGGWVAWGVVPQCYDEVIEWQGGLRARPNAIMEWNGVRVMIEGDD